MKKNWKKESDIWKKENANMNAKTECIARLVLLLILVTIMVMIAIMGTVLK